MVAESAELTISVMVWRHSMFEPTGTAMLRTQNMPKSHFASNRMNFASALMNAAKNQIEPLLEPHNLLEKIVR